jgi:hypothetical protein
MVNPPTDERRLKRLSSAVLACVCLVGIATVLGLFGVEFFGGYYALRRIAAAS